MSLGAWSALEWLALAEHELLLFAGVFFLVGALDELAVDATWLWMKVRGSIRTHRIARSDLRHRRLDGLAAVFIPAWREAEVIGHTLRHAVTAWRQEELLFYIGCYRNDPETLRVAMDAASGDARVRLVVHDRDGPTTKADCLNRLYAAMEEDERRRGRPVRSVVLHDAEDMVDPAALAVLDSTLGTAEFVQLPVLPVPDPRSRWIASHYCEEFAEAHGKSMVVRDALRTGLPAAGVGCAFSRDILHRLARLGTDAEGPFSRHSLTEDYELGLRIAEAGGRSRFVRVRGEDGQLVATRAFFPASLPRAVRQKSRWLHGIAFQGWDRLGWNGGWAENWMRMRDRRGPLTALVLLAGYALLFLSALLAALSIAGHPRPFELSPLIYGLLVANTLALAWRVAMRFAFTAREYGVWEGLRAVLRIPLANVIAIMSARRALFAYARTLRGGTPVWDKTSHSRHPAVPRSGIEMQGQSA